MQFQMFSKIKFHPEGWDPLDLVERPKLIVGSGVEIAVGALKVGLVKKQILVRILFPMLYLFEMF